MKKAITFYYSDFGMELTKVELGKEFKKLDSLAQLDILGDIAGESQEIYQSGVTKWEEDMKLLQKFGLR